jgi:hypothetical protein
LNAEIETMREMEGVEVETRRNIVAWSVGDQEARIDKSEVG